MQKRLISEGKTFKRSENVSHIQAKRECASERKRGRYIRRKAVLIGLALIAASLLWMGAGDREIREGEIIQQKQETKEERLRKRLFAYCADTTDPRVCRELAEAGIKAQNLSGIEGLPEFTLAVASNESRFLPQYCTGNNCLGLGASNPRRHMSFDSYSASVDYLAQLLLNRYGKKSITPSGVWEIASWYAGSPNWAKQILWFMERLRN